jgi:hypothetical protein
LIKETQSQNSNQVFGGTKAHLHWRNYAQGLHPENGVDTAFYSSAVRS